VDRRGDERAMRFDVSRWTGRVDVSAFEPEPVNNRR
jgi:hypothetical protein